jgi:hypothetical protein
MLFLRLECALKFLTDTVVLSVEVVLGASANSWEKRVADALIAEEPQFREAAGRLGGYHRVKASAR